MEVSLHVATETENCETLIYNTKWINISFVASILEEQITMQEMQFEVFTVVNIKTMILKNATLCCLVVS
jgi:hypothetical protein